MDETSKDVLERLPVGTKIMFTDAEAFVKYNNARRFPKSIYRFENPPSKLNVGWERNRLEFPQFEALNPPGTFCAWCQSAYHDETDCAEMQIVMNQDRGPRMPPLIND